MSTRRGVSVVVLMVLALREAFEQSGIATTDRVTLPFDARVYLPADRQTLGNFAAGLDIDCGPDVSPQTMQSEMSEAFATGRPVANLMLSSLKVRAARLSSRYRRRPEASTTPDHRAALLYSSLNIVPRHVPIPWADTAPAQFLVASDPGSPQSITITSAIADGDLTMTAAFDDSVFDRQSVADALKLTATDTAALLPQSSTKLDPRRDQGA